MPEQWEFNKLLPISQSAGKCFKNARLKRPSLSAAALPSLSVCRPSWNSKLYKKKNWFCGFYVNCCHMSTASSSSVRLNSICAAHTYIYIYIYVCIFFGYICFLVVFIFLIVCVLFRQRPHIPLRSIGFPVPGLHIIIIIIIYFFFVFSALSMGILRLTAVFFLTLFSCFVWAEGVDTPS